MPIVRRDLTLSLIIIKSCNDDYLQYPLSNYIVHLTLIEHSLTKISLLIQIS
jgi:hypothetical protein